MVKKLRPMTSQEEEARFRKFAKSWRFRTAVHEAGHAVVSFFFQVSVNYSLYLGSREDFFDWIRSTEEAHADDRAGAMRHERGYNAFFPPIRRQPKRSADLEVLAYDMMESMAGPCAEAFYSGAEGIRDKYQWFKEVQQEHDEDLLEFEGQELKTDYARFERRSRQAYKQASRRWAFEQKVAEWTEEVITDPGVGSAVQSLADFLVKSRRTVHEYPTTNRIMEEAFAGHRYAFEDPKWLERLPWLSQINHFYFYLSP
jgi:hypothetical protein